MTTNTCYKCDKTFSSKYNLNKHQKNCVSCGPGVSCVSCSTNFTSKKTLDEHMTICFIEKLEHLSEKLKTQEESHIKKIEDQDKYYDRLIVAEVVSKEKLKNEAKVI